MLLDISGFEDWNSSDFKLYILSLTQFSSMLMRFQRGGKNENVCQPVGHFCYFLLTVFLEREEC